MLSYLDFALETKGVSDAGTFEGFAAVYRNTDSYRDVILPGAFSKSLMERSAEIPILHSHDMANPVGLGRLSDSAKGLMMAGELDLDITAGREVHSLMKKRILRGLSIGFQIPDGGAEFKDKKRYLKQITLLEVSVVAVPANDQALITSVKSIDGIRGFETFLHSSGFSRNEARRLAAGGWPALGITEPEPDNEELLAWLRSQNRHTG